MTDERSTTRPATTEDLRTVIHALNAHGVPYLLIGGYALAVHECSSERFRNSGVWTKPIPSIAIAPKGDGRRLEFANI
jgi:hypothetical protein